jgi:thiol-disulfide isomerase/thioredoxin
MSSLVFLTTDDFQLIQSDKINILKNKLRGFSLVFFYSPDCIHCKKVTPIYKELFKSLTGIYYSICNVKLCQPLIRASHTTNTPITYVPLIILYVDGIPIQRYDGNYTLREMQNFIVNVTTNYMNQPEFLKTEAKRKKLIYDGFCHAKDSDITYLDYEHAWQ